MNFPTIEKELTNIMVVDFKQERFSWDIIDEMMPLWKAHYDEIALYKDIPLGPDLNVYDKADKLDILKIFTARHEGKLIGYEVFFVHKHPHYSTVKSANQDILFLSPHMRKGLIGYRFIKWVDDQLAEEGVSLIFQNVRVGHNFDALLKRLGYVEHDRLFSRRLS